MRRLIAACLFALSPLAATAGTLDVEALRRSLGEIGARAEGRLGACIREVATGRQACLRGAERFPMLDAAKVPVAVAVLAAVEGRVFRLDEPILVRRADLSVPPQPLAALVGSQGVRLTVDELLQRLVADGDNAAADILLGRIRGPAGVQQALDRRSVTGVRVDRTERARRTELAGIPWDPAFADPAAFAAAAGRVPEEVRRARLDAALRDPRDTATPEGMADLLARLAQGRLLGPAGTERLIRDLEAVRAGEDGLRAGLGPSWRLARMGGAGGDAGASAAGILTAPDGGVLTAAVFLAGSPAPAAEQAGLIAAVARAASAAYR